MRSRRQRSGFTMIEVLIVVVVLGTLAAIVVPQFGDAHDQSAEGARQAQLQRIRVQIEVYRARHGGVAPDFLADQWDELIDDDYLHSVPANPLNESTVIDSAPGAGIGWVWRDKGNGTLALFATDATMLAEYDG